MKNLLKDQVKKNYDMQEDFDNYKCDKCRDMTFIIDDNVAIPCECREIRQAELILKQSGISDEFRNKTFDNFDYSVNKEILSAYIISKTYANKFEEIKNNKNNSIILMGNSGCGKTHLSLSIANSLMDRGIGILYMSYRESIVAIKQCVMDSENYNKTMNKYKNAKVLLIDDLFKGSITPSDINIIFEIINYRYFNNKPMIISTEKFSNNLLDIDEAIGSRILEMCKDFSIELKGKHLNYRIYS